MADLIVTANQEEDTIMRTGIGKIKNALKTELNILKHSSVETHEVASYPS